MSEVKAPERLKDAAVAVATFARHLPACPVEPCSCGLHVARGRLMAALGDEYVPATDSPDREPDAWICGLGSGEFLVFHDDIEDVRDVNHGIESVPLYRNPPDRSDGLREALERLRDLKENWDSYGGKPITPEAIAAARTWLDVLSFVPGCDGGIQIEAHALGAELEISIRPDGTLDISDSALAAAHLALKAESK